jgi:hypothetical protein
MASMRLADYPTGPVTWLASGASGISGDSGASGRSVERGSGKIQPACVCLCWFVILLALFAGAVLHLVFWVTKQGEAEPVQQGELAGGIS